MLAAYPPQELVAYFGLIILIWIVFYLLGLVGLFFVNFYYLHKLFGLLSAVYLYACLVTITSLLYHLLNSIFGIGVFWSVIVSGIPLSTIIYSAHETLTPLYESLVRFKDPQPPIKAPQIQPPTIKFKCFCDSTSAASIVWLIGVVILTFVLIGSDGKVSAKIGLVTVTGFASLFWMAVFHLKIINAKLDAAIISHLTKNKASTAPSNPETMFEHRCHFCRRAFSYYPTDGKVFICPTCQTRVDVGNATSP